MDDFKKLTIIKIKKPEMPDVNKNLQWLSFSLGLFTPRDREKSCFRIFVQLLKEAGHGKALSSDELAFKLNLSRGTVVFHLKKLMYSGLVEKRGDRYVLKEKWLKELVKGIRYKADMALDEIEKVAAEIDRAL